MKKKREITSIKLLKYLVKDKVSRQDIYTINEIVKHIDITRSLFTATLLLHSPHIWQLVEKLPLLESLLDLESDYFVSTANQIAKLNLDYSIDNAVESLYFIKYSNINYENVTELNRINIIKKKYQFILNAEEKTNRNFHLFKSSYLPLYNFLNDTRKVANKQLLIFNEVLSLPIDWHIQELVKANEPDSITEHDSFYVKHLNADILQDITSLLGGSEKSYTTEDTVPQSKETTDELTITIPFYKDTSLSAGGGVESYSFEADGLAINVQDFLHFYGVSRSRLKNVTAVYIRGDSMFPDFNNNQIVYIDHSIKAVESTGIYAIRKDNNLYIKNATIDNDYREVFFSSNKNYSDSDIELNDQSLNQIEILGKVLKRKI